MVDVPANIDGQNGGMCKRGRDDIYIMKCMDSSTTLQ